MANLKVFTALPKSKIDKNIYGFFSEHLGRCIYEGTWVGKDSPIPNVRGIRTDVVEALKKLNIPVLRWPGGCFADTYHWEDGIGPYENRKFMINIHWGGTVENNHFGTHEFFDLCDQLGCEPYICGNLGSGTVREMSEWVEYMTFDGRSPMSDLRRENGREEAWKIRYFGVGNENWGCGGNMTPEYYVNEYKRYQSYCRNYGDNKLFKIACGPNTDDYHWTEVMMRDAGNLMDGLSLHYYTARWPQNGTATGFEEEFWFDHVKRAYHSDELITKHDNIMTKHDPDKRVALIFDEWGTWFNVEPGTNPGFLYQQNSLLDVITGAVSLNIFNSHSDRLRMANLAQTVNVLQSVILTEGAKMILTPTYHLFDLFKGHQDATLLQTSLESPAYSFEGASVQAVSVSASRAQDGSILITLCNTDAKNDIPMDMAFDCAVKDATARIITADKLDTHNTFEEPENLTAKPFALLEKTDAGLKFVLPAGSVVAVTVDAK